MPSPELTPKQEEFCRLYLETGNASEAYRRAYDAGKMKPATVNRKAFELLENGKITARIQELQKKAADKAVLDRAWVLSRLMKTARIGLGEEMVKVRVRKPKSTEVEEIEVHWPDLAAANRSLELLGKSAEVRLFVDQLELTGKDGKDLMPEASPRDIARAIVDVLRTATLEASTYDRMEQAGSGPSPAAPTTRARAQTGCASASSGAASVPACHRRSTDAAPPPKRKSKMATARKSSKSRKGK